MKENLVFNQMADYYDSYRVDYPNSIIETIIEKGKLTSESRVLEIGAGSGKATAHFVEYGMDILCIEPGNDLARKGKQRFAGKKVKYLIATFEETSLEEESFDAILSAQAFHWVRQPEGYALCAKYLKRKGMLMPFWNIEILRDTDTDREMFDIISRYNAYTSVMWEEEYRQRSRKIAADLEESGFFSRPQVIRIERELCFTADEYFGHALTGNMFVKNSEGTKMACHEELKKLEVKRGTIKRNFITELYVAQKL